MIELTQARPKAGVHSIDHFALNVPSIQDAKRFFEAFGFDVGTASSQGDELALRATDGHRSGLAFFRQKRRY